MRTEFICYLPIRRSHGSAVNRLDRDSPELHSRLSESARELAVSRYDWASLGARLYDIHSGLVEQNASARQMGTSSRRNG